MTAAKKSKTTKRRTVKKATKKCVGCTHKTKKKVGTKKKTTAKKRTTTKRTKK